MKEANNIVFIIVLVLIIFIPKSYSQQNYSAEFSGKLLIDAIPCDSVTFTLRPEYLYNYLNSRSITVPCDKEGEFWVNLALENNIEMVDIILYGQKNIYFTGQYIEHGDQIRIDNVGDDKISRPFKGKGSAKYNYVEESKHFQSFEYFMEMRNDTTLNKGIDLHGYESILASQSRHNHLKNVTLATLDKYRKTISKRMLQIFQQDIDAIFNLALLNDLRNEYLLTKDERIVKIFEENHNHSSKIVDKYPNTYLSEYQVLYLYRLSQTRLALKKQTRNKSIKEMYQQIISDYDYIIAERIFSFFLLSNPIGNAEEYQECLMDAKKRSSNSKTINFLTKRLESSTVGLKLLDFGMQDISGTQVSINDFTGKVVFIDFWFTGCVPCLHLAKKIHESVYPIFKDYDDVIFLTINLDKNNDQWRMSLDKGSYTTPNSINLWTNGLAFSHPFIVHYGIKALPTLFVVDKDGRIISTNHSRDTEEIITTLRKNLN